MSDMLDVIIDAVTPQSAKDVQNIYKVGKAIDKVGSKPTMDSVSDLQSVLKKGWIEKAEKKVKADVKRMNMALKNKSEWPEEKIDTFEKKVFVAYKAESKKGLEPVDCKKTIAAIRPLLKEIDRHRKALKDIEYLCKKSIEICAKWEKDYAMRKEYAAELAKNFKFLTKVAVLSAAQAEMLTYYLHCMELTKQFSEAESCAKKLGKRAFEDMKEARSRQDMAKNQYDYSRGSAYWEDLPSRI